MSSRHDELFTFLLPKRKHPSTQHAGLKCMQGLAPDRKTIFFLPHENRLVGEQHLATAIMTPLPLE